MSKESWTLAELRQALEDFETELKAADLRPSSVRTYVDRSAIFVR
jgi:hypothetical protein